MKSAVSLRVRVASLLGWCALACARVRPSERDALWALYEATDGPRWTNNENWDPSIDPCRRSAAPIPYEHGLFEPEPFDPGATYEPKPWFGVGCIDPCDDYLDGDGCTAGRITSLRLGDNNLTGGLSGWHGVGQMANLTYLDLSYNRLSGTLPTQLGQINNLDVLLLQGNELSGLLPPELASLNSNGHGKLRELNLGYNALSGTLPAGMGAHNRSLLMLDARSNRLSGTIPDDFSSLHRLQVLYLNNNSLSGTLPDEIGGGDTMSGMHALRYLEAQDNAELSGTLPTSLGALKELFTIRLNGGQLSGTLPTEMGALGEARTLALHDNSLSGSLPSEVGAMLFLETLDVYSNPLDGDLPTEIARLINLQKLYVPNEQLLPLRLHYCQQRLPNLGKYSYRLVREEFARFSSAVCPEPYSTLQAFGSLAEQSGDV